MFEAQDGGVESLPSESEKRGAARPPSSAALVLNPEP